MGQSNFNPLRDGMIEESLVMDRDQRKQVKNSTTHPFSGLGKLIATFQVPMMQKPQTRSGVAFFITQKHLLTAKHILIIWHSPSKQYLTPSKIDFYPEPLTSNQSLPTKPLQLKIYTLGCASSKTNSRNHDCAILKLKQRQKIPFEKVLTLQYDYSIQNHLSQNILIPGYPSPSQIYQLQLQTQTQFKNSLFYDERKPHHEDHKGILKYQHSTTKGTSGAPLLLRISAQLYHVIGIHIGNCINEDYNSGILLKNCPLKNVIRKLIHNENLISGRVQPQLPSTSSIQVKSRTSSQSFLELIASNQHTQKDENSLSFLKPNFQRKSSTILFTESELEQKLSNVEMINLESFEITDVDMVSLTQNVSRFRNLLKIHLQKNKITDVGLKVFAQNGYKFYSLEEFSIGNNLLTDVGIKDFSENGKNFKNLKIVNFYQNKIGDRGVKELALNGGNFEALQSIDLDKNKVMDEGLIELVENGKKWKKLEIIFLWDNRITERGWNSIEQKLKKLKFKIEAGY